MILLKDDSLEFYFPEVHERALCSINFQRTLRIPDDGDDYPLPPGLGAFPLRHLDDYAAHLPEAWRERGGVIAPMHQAEAMWINFQSVYPFAVKVATGKICAITGDSWVNHLNQDPQDYAVLPEQPWLDGYCVEKGIIRQFVAMPLGEGYSVEEQLTGAAVHGGIQISAYPLKAERYNAFIAQRRRSFQNVMFQLAPAAASMDAMGLSPGGRMKQKIYDDKFGLDAWDQRHSSRCFISLLNSAQWISVTGERPPTKPPTAQEYAARGLPWFDHYGGDKQAVAGAEKLRGLKSVAQKAWNKINRPLTDNEPVTIETVIALGKPRPVRESALGSAES